MRKERILYLLIFVVIAVAAITLLRSEDSVLSIENKRYWISKTYSSETFPVVFAGDSRVFRGVSPAEFKEVTGVEAINLGYSSNGFHPSYLDFLEERLDKSADKPVIVLGLSSHSFSRNGSGSYAFRAEVNRKKEEVMQYMNFYQLSKLFSPLQVLKLLGMEEKNNFRANYHIKYHFDGWMESYWDRRDTTNSDISYKVIFNDNQFNEDAAGILFRQVQKWKEEDITVVAFRSPTTHTIRVLEDSLSGFDFEPFRQELIASGAHWIEVDRKKYQTYDGNHLEAESAKQFTRDLALEIGELIADSDQAKKNGPSQTK